MHILQCIYSGKKLETTQIFKTEKRLSKIYVHIMSCCEIIKHDLQRVLNNKEHAY